MSEIGMGICQWRIIAKQSLQYLSCFSLSLCLIGCDTSLQELVRRPAAKSKPTPSETIKPTPLPTPTLQKLTVTVESSSDLKVKQGDAVVKGQVISEPTETRQRISQRRQSIQQQLTQLNALALEPRLTQQNALQQPSDERVERAKVRLNAAEAALAQYRRDSPYTEFALQNLPLPAEQVKFDRLQGEVQAAKAALEREKTVLAKVRSGVSTNQGNGVSNLKTTQANLNKELQQLDTRSKALKVVYSPYTGLINTITPLGSQSGGLQFELAFSTQAAPSTPGSPSSPSLPQNPLAPPQLPSGLSTPVPQLPTSPQIPSGLSTPVPQLPSNITPQDLESLRRPRPQPTPSVPPSSLLN